MTDTKTPPPARPEKAPPARLPYERPAVISEEVFETMALSCAAANEWLCPGGSDRS